MPAPAQATYSVAALVDAHTALLALIDAGSGPGKIFIRDDSDVLLAEVPLDDPGGTVNGGTGQLTLAIDGPDTAADATGIAAYGEIADSDDTVILALPAQQGASPVSGYLVMNTLAVVIGGPVDILTATIG